MNPGRTRDTELQYLKRAAQIVEAIGEHQGCGAEQVEADTVAKWLYGRRTAITARTFRLYRAALAFYYDHHGKEGDLIRNTSHDRDCVKAKHGLTSSRKKKYIPQKSAGRLVSLLRNHGGKWGDFTADVFQATLSCGLRPIEWNTAKLVGDRLCIQNAKATNGRGNGPVRTLILHAEAADQASKVIDRIKRLPRGVNWHNAVRVTLRTVRMQYYPKSQYTLYTARHQFSANAKASESRRRVADLMGHRSVDTAAVHYGRRVSGWKQDRAVPAYLGMPAKENRPGKTRSG
jgi:integrase